MSPLFYFTDPVLRGPTIGCMLMCLSAALVGVLVFLRKQSLLGEALSHASYPGVILGIFLAGSVPFIGDSDAFISFVVIVGASISSILGLYTIHWLERKLKVRSDAALCFVLSAFFGIGVTFASRVQFSLPTLYRRAESYLYGQAATMTDRHIILYSILALGVIAIILLFYKELQMITFDRDYATSQGVPIGLIDTLTMMLIVSAVVIGIRSVGVVLISAMLIAPASAARQFSNKLYLILPLAALFGIISGFFGNYFSFELSGYLSPLSIPTGPMIVVVASSICILALFFAPERGLIVRLLRVVRFRYRCHCENILKQVWRYGEGNPVTFDQILTYQPISPLYLHWILNQLVHNGWMERKETSLYTLTDDGYQWAAKIIRLHRLWEVYLVDFLGVGAERVHRSAEEMEHILTPEIEQRLTELLNDPKRDPHKQPIPPMEN